MPVPQAKAPSLASTHILECDLFISALECIAEKAPEAQRRSYLRRIDQSRQEWLQASIDSDTKAIAARRCITDLELARAQRPDCTK